MNIRYLTAAFAFVALAACNSEEKLSPFESDPNAVRITATVGEQAARSFPTTALDDVKATQFKEGDAIAISTLNQETVTYLYTNGKWEPQDEKFLIWETDPQYFTAYYPADKYSGTQSVPTKQDTEDDIAAADYMKFEDELTWQDPIRLTMLRQTARIVIDATACTWKNQYLAEDKQTETHEVKSILVHCKKETATISIQPYKVGNVYYALVNPSNNADDTEKFITIKVGPKDNDSSDAQDELIIRGIPVLNAGNSYTCQLTLGKDKVELGSITVSDWATGTVIDNGKAVEADYFKLGPDEGKYSYHIYSLDGLLEVNKILTASNVTEDELRADIILYNDFTLPTPATGESNWTPIGNEENKFHGNFNGNGHTIRGLVVRSNPASSAQGLIGFTDGNVSNLTLEGCTVIGNKWVGGIVGINYGYNIENCKVIATKDYPVWIESAGGLVGGITGRHFYGTILKSSLVCESGASITIKNTGQASNVGGIAGHNDTGAMNECSVINNGGTITITSVSNNVGGFVGKNSGEGSHTVDFCIRNCSVDGVSVTGAEYVGGFAGMNDNNAEIRDTNTVTNSVVTGKTGTTNITVGKNFSTYHVPGVTNGGGNKLITN